MKRIGTVVVFKAGVTQAQAADALRKIADVIDTPPTSYVRSDTTKHPRYVDVPFAFEHTIHEYNSDHGGPVWYIP